MPKHTSGSLPGQRADRVASGLQKRRRMKPSPLPGVRLRTLVRLVAACAMVSACSAERPSEAPPASEQQAPAPATNPPARPGADTSAAPAPAPDAAATLPQSASQEWRTGTVQAPATLTPVPPVPEVRAVRTAAQDGYDRLTVELSPGVGLPGYHVEYIDRPLIQCGSGDQIFPVGDAWLELRLEPTNAHTEAGAPTLAGRELPASGRLFRRLYLTCDFEAVTTLVMAVSSPSPFRVFTLASPPRIVIDVRH